MPRPIACLFVKTMSLSLSVIRLQNRVRNLRLAGPVGNLATLLNADALLVGGTIRRPTGVRLWLHSAFNLPSFRFLMGLKRTIYHSIMSAFRRFSVSPRR